jgi:hypothetical protein
MATRPGPNRSPRRPRAHPCSLPLTGGSGPDTLVGTALGDLIHGARGADVILGLAGADCAFGESGADEIHGGGGNDRFKGGRGRDHIKGGSGSDVIQARDGRSDSVNCGRGRDTARVDQHDVLRRREVLAAVRLVIRFRTVHPPGDSRLHPLMRLHEGPQGARIAFRAIHMSKRRRL